MAEQFQIAPLAAPRKSETAPDFLELMGASMRAESGVSAILQIAKKQTFPRDPQFSVSEYFVKRPDLIAYQSRFEDVQSDAEAQALETKIKQEEKDRAIREAAGFAGIMSDLSAMVASPDIFLPMGTASKGLRGVSKIALASAGQSAAHELTMQAAQETRTGEESATAIFGSAVLGAVLGSAVAMLSRREFEAAAAKVLVDPSEMRLMPQHSVLDRSVGAMEVGGVRMTDPGELLGVLTPEEAGSANFRQRALNLAHRALGMDPILSPEQVGTASVMAKLNDRMIRAAGLPSPVARNLLSRFPKIRGIQAQLADAGLYYKEGVVAPHTIEAKVRRLTNTYEAKALHILDDAYGDYYFGYKPGNVVQRMHAEVGGLVPIGGRLTRRQFSEQVFIEAQQPAEGAIPQVKKAAEALRAEFYDPIFEEMKAVGLVSPDETAESLMGQLAYVTHIYDRDAVIKNPEAFISMIEKSYQRQMRGAFGERVAALKAQEAQDFRDLEDMVRPAEEVEQLIEQLQYEREVFKDSQALMLSDSLRNARRELAQIRDKQALAGPGTDPTKPVFPAQVRVKELEERIKTLTGLTEAPEVAKALALDKAARRRLQVLSGSKAALTKRQEKIFESIEARDEEAIRVLRGVAHSISKMNEDLDSMSDAAFAKAKKELKVEIGRANRRLKELDKKADELEAELNFARAEGTDDPTALFDKDQLAVLKGRLRATQRLDDATEVLDDLDPVGARAVLKEWQDDVITDTVDRLGRINERRARLVERAKAVDPKQVEAKIAATKEGGELRRARLSEWVGKMGGEMDDGDIPNFAEGGRALGKDVRQRIIGNPVNVVGLDLTMEKGAELARVLNIPLEEKMPWLETDMDRLVRIYARSVLPGIELSRAGFGVNGAKALDEVVKVYDRESLAIAKWTPEDMPSPPRKKAGETPEEFDVRAKGLLAQAKEKAHVALEKERKNTLLAFTGQFQRLRHQRAIPDNPDSYLYRGGRTLSQLNVLDFMGNVAISQLTDPALAVSRLGVKRIFKYAIKPLITDFKNLRMSQREALYSGLDEMTTQARLYQMADLLEDAGTRRTKGEQAVEWLANKQGIVALFTPMNHAVRQFLMPAVAGKLLDAMEVLAAGKTLHGISVKKATQDLAEAGLDGDMVARIWAERGAGGIVNHNGLWIPNTESWTDVGAREAYRQAAMNTMDNVIVVPGLERPLFVDKTMGHKLLTQFQSFMWSTQTKVLMAGLQKRDFDVAVAFLAAVPLAALSYYASRVAKGEGDEALAEDFDVWADEIIARHPMFGALSLALRIGQEVPAVRPYLQFSDRGSERRLSSGLEGAVLGPSYTTARRGFKLASELDDPTQSTAHTTRQLVPYNQVFYMRWLFDKIEKEGAASLPKERN